jgi:hypothetical protein
MRCGHDHAAVFRRKPLAASSGPLGRRCPAQPLRGPPSSRLSPLQPTFIKIGQQFSTRVDVLSPEFVKELEKLQVRTQPRPAAGAGLMGGSLGQGPASAQCALLSAARRGAAARPGTQAGGSQRRRLSHRLC